MQSADGEFDYTTLSEEGLKFAIEHIDAQTHPLNLANAQAALSVRKARPAAESPQPSNAKSDAAFALAVERLLAAIIILYAVLSISKDDLILPAGRLAHIRIIHLHGTGARIAFAGIMVIAGVMIMGGFDQSDPPKLRPNFRIAVLFALVLIIVGIAVRG